MASDILAPSKTREKIALKPGFHLVDWMNLMRVADVSGRKGAPLRRISMKEVREHNSRYDCWTVYNKKVYNITNYMDYHPGVYDLVTSISSLSSLFLELTLTSQFTRNSAILQEGSKNSCWVRERIAQTSLIDIMLG